MVYINEIMNSLGLTGFYDEVYMGIVFISFSLLALILLNFRKVFSLTGFMYLLWIIAIAFLSYVGNLIYCDTTNQYTIMTLLIPVGIILASFIASASVMSSIKSNEKLNRMTMVGEHQSQLLFMIHILSEMRESYVNIVASNNFAAHNYMFFQNDQKRIAVMYENCSSLLQDQYFFFLTSGGYNEFKEIQNDIFELNENANERIGSSFSINYTLFQKTLMTNLDDLLEILNKQQKELNRK